MKRGMGTVYLRGRIWWLQWYRDGQQHNESSGSTSKTVATEKLKEKFRESQPRRATVAHLLADLQAHYEVENPTAWRDFARYCVNGKHGLMEYWGRYEVQQVTTDALRKWVRWLKGEGHSAARINRKVAVLRRAMRLGAHATPPKVGALPLFPRLQEAPPRSGFLDPDGYRRLLDALPADLQPVLVCGYHLGIRRSELLALRRSDVDLRHLEIRLPGERSKNRQSRTVPIYGEMIETLRACEARTSREWPGCPLVFHRRGEPLRFREEWTEACKVAGLAGLLFHDLRRSAVRNMVRAGINESVAMAITGHRTRAVFQRYDIISGSDLQRAGELAAAYIAAPEPEKRRKRA